MYKEKKKESMILTAFVCYYQTYTLFHMVIISSAFQYDRLSETFWSASSYHLSLINAFP